MLDIDSGMLQESDSRIIAINLVVIDVLDAALLNQKGTVNAWGVGDKDACSATGKAVKGQFGNRIEFGVLHLGTRHEFAVHLHFATVIVPGRHAVPTDGNDGIVLDNHAPDLKPHGITAFGCNLSDVHVHRVVFFNVHDEVPPI